MKLNTNQAGGSNKQFSVPLSLDVYDVVAMTGAYRGLLRRLDNRERVRLALYYASLYISITETGIPARSRPYATSCGFLC